MIFEFLKETEEGIKIYARIDDDGKCRLTCTEDHPEYLRWLENPDADTWVEPQLTKE